MKNERPTVSSLLVLFAAIMLMAACSKKIARVTPPPPPLAAPAATLVATPDVIERGQSAVLKWQTANSTDITIAGLGMVSQAGSRSVNPATSTTYTLVAKGPGGKMEVSARVTVNAKSNSAAAQPLTDEELFSKNVRDVFFDYDKSYIRPDQLPTAQSNAAFLKQYPSMKVVVEGRCDDRGSEEYNLALGSSRAEAMRQALLQDGISADRIKTVSYGKEKPLCTDDNEGCWQQNRVDHLAIEH
jgi:peptidoglycan-associated lipoprotein